jgi:hypothetical protein
VVSIVFEDKLIVERLVVARRRGLLIFRGGEVVVLASSHVFVKRGWRLAKPLSLPLNQARGAVQVGLPEFGEVGIDHSLQLGQSS